MQIAGQWGQGLPSRTAAKVLRKAGIHPWSLLVLFEEEQKDRLIRDLKAPPYIQTACKGPMSPGFWFRGAGVPRRLPENLVLRHLELVECSKVRRLPRRLWLSSLVVTECTHLESLAHGGGRLTHVSIEQCHRLLDVGLRMETGSRMDVSDCPRIARLPIAPRFSKVVLKNLQGLKVLPGLKEVKDLSVWRMPHLKDLRPILVTETWVAQGCPELERPPRVLPHIKGCVADCPRLNVSDLTDVSSELEMVPHGFGNTLPPSDLVPSEQAVTVDGLTGLDSIESECTWPWPGRKERSGLDRRLDSASKALGLSPMDRLRMHQLDESSSTTIYQMLLAEHDPIDAVQLGAVLLHQALEANDTSMALNVCLEVERLGLGALSVCILAARKGRHKETAVTEILGSYWSERTGCLWGASLGFPKWYNAPVVPGSLILFGWTYITRNTELRCIEGPLLSIPSLWIGDCPRLEQLPNRMFIRGDLTVEYCPRLTSFPSQLVVDGNLILRDLFGLHAQDCRARVGGTTTIEGCPGLKILPMDKT